MKDLYSVLGLARGAGSEEVKRAYRRLAREFHPDVNPGDAHAEERFKEISRAHDVLSDEGKRALYDEFGADSLRPGFRPAASRAIRGMRSTMRSGPRASSSGSRHERGSRAGGPLGGLEGLLSGWFGGRSATPERGPDLEIPVGVSLAEVGQGAARTVAVRRPAACPVCAGAGRDAVAGRCAACGGRGQNEESVKLRVKIPAGIDHGARIRVAGKGGAGRGGAPAGDLFVVVSVEADPHFERSGRDLTIELPITVTEALQGASVNVPTLDGEVSLRIPAGTQSGQRFRLKGRGLPEMNGAGRGDLYVRAMVHLPAPSEEALQAAAALDRFYAESPRKGLRR